MSQALGRTAPGWGHSPTVHSESTRAGLSSSCRSRGQGTVAGQAERAGRSNTFDEEKRKAALARLRKLSQKYISPDITTEEIRERTAMVAEEAARKRAERITQREAQQKNNAFNLPFDANSVRGRLPSIKREDVERMRDRLQKLNREDIRSMKLSLQEKATSSRVSTLLKSWTSCGGNLDTVCAVDGTSDEYNEASRFDLLEENLNFILQEQEDEKQQVNIVNTEDEKSTESYDDDRREGRGCEPGGVGEVGGFTTQSFYDDDMSDDDQNSLDSLEQAFLELSRGDSSAAPQKALKKVRNFAHENGLGGTNSDDFVFQPHWPDAF